MIIGARAAALTLEQGRAREYNKKLIELLDYNDKRTKYQRQLTDTIDEFNALTPDQQVQNILLVTTLHEIQNLILLVKTIREPEKQHQYYLQMKIGDSYRDWFKKWLLSNCIKNGQKYQNEILKLLEQIQNSLSKE